MRRTSRGCRSLVPRATCSIKPLRKPALIADVSSSPTLSNILSSSSAASDGCTSGQHLRNRPVPLVDRYRESYYQTEGRGGSGSDRCPQPVRQERVDFVSSRRHLNAIRWNTLRCHHPSVVSTSSQGCGR